MLKAAAEKGWLNHDAVMMEQITAIKRAGADGLEGGDAYTAKSLATPAGVEDGLVLGDTLGAEDHGYESVEARVVVGPALETLDERDQTILRLRFYDNLTQSQIADRIGVSQMHVSRLISKALATLRTRITVDND